MNGNCNNRINTFLEQKGDFFFKGDRGILLFFLLLVVAKTEGPLRVKSQHGSQPQKPPAPPCLEVGL